VKGTKLLIYTKFYYAFIQTYNITNNIKSWAYEVCCCNNLAHPSVDSW